MTGLLSLCITLKEGPRVIGVFVVRWVFPLWVGNF